MRTSVFLFMVFVFGLTGCSSYKSYVSEDLTSYSEIKTPKYNDEEIKELFARKANLPAQFKLAVYFKHSQAYNGSDWRWSQEDRDSILNLLRANAPKDRVASIFELNSHLVRDPDLRDIRTAAAKARADAVLVIEGVGAVKTDMNSLSGTYVLLLPAFFVPGNTIESLFVVNSAMWDVRNEMLYMSSSSEGQLSDEYVPAWKKRDAFYLAEAKSRALESFKNRLTQDLSQIR
ncbi:MAG: hypothetical protein K2Q26_06050 [Bdellovibrionales bacterium]|nr:hypothetical protein [Bdellovibrionales bacterium]